MKTRACFVSNSSSTMFMLPSDCFTDEQYAKIDLYNMTVGWPSGCWLIQLRPTGMYFSTRSAISTQIWIQFFKDIGIDIDRIRYDDWRVLDTDAENTVKIQSSLGGKQ